MKLTHLATAILFAATATASYAASPDSYIGKPPSHLMKKQPQFAKAVRDALKDQDLPDWTQRLAVGFPAEAVEIDGKKLILTSACSPQGGCKDERLYLLYVPGEKTVTGFFFLAPNLEAPGDHRIAMSRWLGGVPPKARSDFLMQRALEDTWSPEEKAAAKEAEAAKKTPQ